MNDAKYIGLDVHQATISMAVLDSAGKLASSCLASIPANIVLPGCLASKSFRMYAA
jgi:hypothetical protein